MHWTPFIKYICEVKHWALPFSLIVSYGLHTSFINSLVQKNKNIHANPIKSLRFGLCHTFTPRPWKHGFAFTPQAWRYDTNQTLSIKIQLKRMIYLQQELGRAWVCLPLGISLGLRPREIPRGRQTQALPRSCRRYIPFQRNYYWGIYLFTICYCLSHFL